MDLLVAIAIGVACLVGVGFYLGNQQTRAEAARQHLLFQEVVRDLLTSRDPGRFRTKLYDSELRKVQIIAESMDLVLQTKNKETRSSRLELIDDMVSELREGQWEGFDPASRQLVLEAQYHSHQFGAGLGAQQAAEKHLRAVARSTKPETQRRYLQLAADELAPVIEKLAHAKVVKDLKLQLAEINARIAEIDSMPTPVPKRQRAPRAGESAEPPPPGRGAEEL